MKKVAMWVCVACAMTAAADPSWYAADVSTPEKKAALAERLWKHDPAADVRIWPADRLPAGADQKPYVFTEKELHQSNLVIGQVVNPQFTFFPAKGAGRRPAVVICPGGGYHVLGWNKEGTEIAVWLNSLGFSAAVLLYRTDDRDGALGDAQRTMGVLRRDAKKFGIDPKRIGVIGFSAGANLAVRLATNWRKRIYARVDDADDCPCRPDFMMPIYPWDIRPKGPDGKWQGMELAPQYPVDAETPPSFTAQAIDDFCQVETAVTLDCALRKAGVASTIRIYPKGGHGYGLRRLGTPCDVWSSEAAAWLAQFTKPVRRVAFLGDSITDRRHIGCTKNYWGFLADRFGFEALVYGVNGHQMSHVLGQAEKLRAEQGDDVDDIFIFAGTNDFNASVPLGVWYEEKEVEVSRNGRMVKVKRRALSQDPKTFRGRINRVLGYLRATYARPRIILLTPIHRGFAQFGAKNVQPDESYANETGLYIDDYVAAVKEAANVWAATVVDIHAESGLYPNSPVQTPYIHQKDTDRLHPSTAGHRRIADAIAERVSF